MSKRSMVVFMLGLASGGAANQLGSKVRAGLQGRLANFRFAIPVVEPGW